MKKGKIGGRSSIEHSLVGDQHFFSRQFVTSRNPRGRSKTRPAKRKTLDTRHMVKIQAGSPEAVYFCKLRQTHMFRTRFADGVLTNFSS